MKSICLLIIVFSANLSCTKRNQEINTDISGEWVWLGTYQGPWHGTPAPDSAYVLSFAEGRFYQVMLNGHTINSGSYTTDSTKYYSIIDIYPSSGFGVNTSLVFGQFNLSEVSTASISGDTLVLVNYPTHPESEVIYFRKL